VKVVWEFSITLTDDCKDHSDDMPNMAVNPLSEREIHKTIRSMDLPAGVKLKLLKINRLELGRKPKI
jgi:hypothetical protein